MITDSRSRYGGVSRNPDLPSPRSYWKEIEATLCPGVVGENSFNENIVEVLRVGHDWATHKEALISSGSPRLTAINCLGWPKSLPNALTVQLLLDGHLASTGGLPR